MSILIDKLIEQTKNNSVDINSTYYIAKPLPFYGLCEISKRLKDCYMIMADKSRAYHFKQDEIEVSG